jgi:hypothetical protein
MNIKIRLGNKEYKEREVAYDRFRGSDVETSVSVIICRVSCSFLQLTGDI